MVIYPWFAAIVALAGATQELLTFRRQVFDMDDVTQIPKRVGCTNKMDQLRNKFMDESVCAVREVYLGLAPPTTFQSVSPDALWVKRCVGACPHSDESFTCQPLKIVRRRLPITLYNVKTAQYHCSIFTLEEHESCHCDHPESSCTPQGVTLDVDLPSDKATVHPGINPGTVWIKQCTGNCGAYDSSCMPEQAVVTDLVIFSGVYKAEEHESCHCDSSVSPCRPKDAYIELPTNYESAHPSLDFGLFLTKRCAGNCTFESDGFKCMPLKTVLRNVYDTLWKVEEHVNCVCAKQEIPFKR